MARIIAVANRKGGVGKTTTTVSLGAALAARGKRVLLVDLDSQQSLCSSLKVEAGRPGLGDVLFSHFVVGVGNLQEVFVDVGSMAVAGGCDLAHIDAQLRYYGSGWEYALALTLGNESSLFDFVLLDCSPSLGCLTINALAAADEVLIPIQTEFLAVSQLAAILSTVDSVRESTNPNLEVAGFLPTLFDVRTRHSVDVLMKISTEAVRHGVRVFRPIPRTVRVAEAAASGKPISEFAPQSAAALSYDALAVAIERRHWTEDPLKSTMEESQALCERVAAETLLGSTVGSTAFV